MKKKSKKKIKIILSVITLLMIFLFLGFSYFMGSQIVSASTQLVTNEGTKDTPDSFWERYGIDRENFTKTYKIEKLEIASTFGDHTIPADYIYAKQSQDSKDNKTVVLVHGLGGNRYSNYPLAEMFLEQGYNVITYDQRSSNENTAPNTTFGYWEKYDLMDCINYVKENSPTQILGVWGTSFGGATAGLAMGHEDTEQKVDFLILDCPVSSMKWMIEEEMKTLNTGMPISYLTWCGNIINKLKLGFTYDDADVSNAMKDIEIPVLIINSEVDKVTPYFMGKEIYDSIKGNNKWIWTVEDSEHTNMWEDYNQEYRDRVSELMEIASR